MIGWLKQAARKERVAEWLGRNADGRAYYWPRRPLTGVVGREACRSAMNFGERNAVM